MPDRYEQPIAAHTAHLLSAVRWLLSKQNRDGSWGSSNKEKVRWTANAVYTLTVLGFKPERVRQLKKAIEWLKTVPDDHEEWYLRIQPLLTVGLGSWLEAHNDFERAKELIRTDAVGSLSIKVALVIELLDAKVDLPNLDVIVTQVLATLREEGQRLASFGGSTNDTTLYCNFLKIATGSEHQRTINECIEWVRIRAVERSNGNAVCWEESYGKTAYVILNLLRLIDVAAVEHLVFQAINYFQPSEGGEIPPDVIPAHDSLSSTYTTILFIRVMGTFLHCYPEHYRSAFIFLLSDLSIVQSRPHGWLKVAALLLAMLIVFGLTYFLLWSVLGKEFISNVSASLVAAGCVALFALMLKIYNRVMGGKR